METNTSVQAEDATTVAPENSVPLLGAPTPFTQVSVSQWISVGTAQPPDSSSLYVRGNARVDGSLMVQSLQLSINGEPTTASIVVNGETPGQLGVTGALRVEDALGLGTQPTDDLKNVGRLVVRGAPKADLPLQVWQNHSQDVLAVVDADGRLGTGTAALTGHLTVQGRYIQALNGTVSGDINVARLTGIGTAFTTQLRTGDWISIPAAGSTPGTPGVFKVEVKSDTELLLSPLPEKKFTNVPAFQDETLLVSVQNANGVQQLTVGSWGDLTVAGGAMVAGGLSANGPAHLGGTLTVIGATSLTGLAVSGSSTMNGVSVTGPATFGDVSASGTATIGALKVPGKAELGEVSVAGGATADHLRVAGAATLGSLLVGGVAETSGLSVSGPSTLSGLNVTGRADINGLNVSGPSTLSGLNVTGRADASGLNVTGRADISGLNVSGLSTLSGLNVTGRADISGLNVSGQTNLSGLLVTGDARIGSMVIPGGVEAIRLIRGNINANGSSISTVGSGFRASRVAEGQYRIDFDTPFPSVPSASATQVYSDKGNPGKTTDNAVIYGLTAATILVATGDSNGDRKDRSFTFVVMGPR